MAKQSNIMDKEYNITRVQKHEEKATLREILDDAGILRINLPNVTENNGEHSFVLRRGGFSGIAMVHLKGGIVLQTGIYKRDGIEGTRDPEKARRAMSALKDKGYDESRPGFGLDVSPYMSRFDLGGMPNAERDEYITFGPVKTRKDDGGTQRFSPAVFMPGRIANAVLAYVRSVYANAKEVVPANQQQGMSMNVNEEHQEGQAIT